MNGGKTSSVGEIVLLINDSIYSKQVWIERTQARRIRQLCNTNKKFEAIAKGGVSAAKLDARLIDRLIIEKRTSV